MLTAEAIGRIVSWYSGGASTYHFGIRAAVEKSATATKGCSHSSDSPPSGESDGRTRRTDRVFWNHTLLESDWQPGSPLIARTGATATWADDGSVSPRRFYKIDASCP